MKPVHASEIPPATPEDLERLRNASIRGSEFSLNVAATPALRESVLRYFRSRWPGSVFDVDPDWDGVFFYRDAAAKAAWDAVGGEEVNQDTMVHALYSDKAVTFVVSDVEGAETRRIAQELLKNIELNFHIFPRT